MAQMLQCIDNNSHLWDKMSGRNESKNIDARIQNKYDLLQNLIQLHVIVAMIDMIITNLPVLAKNTL